MSALGDARGTHRANHAATVRAAIVAHPLSIQLGAVRIAVRVGRQRHVISYYTSDANLRNWRDALIPLLLPAAMRLSRALAIDAAVSTKQLAATATAQGILTAWHADMTRISIKARSRRRAAPARGAAVLFSAGLDSFYSLLMHFDAIRALVYIDGYDVPPWAPDHLRQSIRRNIHAAAAATGKPLIELHTDARNFAKRAGVSHSRIFCGPSLAAACLLLGESFGRFYVPSSHSYIDLSPLPTHPMLDPLWSTESVEIVHDGADVNRAAKAALVGRYAPAQQYLHVCLENQVAAYNCGKCEKCLRTMINLDLAGLLRDCRTLPHNLSLSSVRAIKIKDSSTRSLLVDNMRTAELRRRPRLTSALRTALERFDRSRIGSTQVGAA